MTASSTTWPAQFHLDAETIQSLGASVLAEERAHGHRPQPLEARLWDACRVRAQPRMDSLAQRIEPAATWDDLVLPGPALDLLREIAVHVRHRARVYGAWGFAARGARGLGISALFAGASGTGKTMAAEVIAHELRLDLYRIDLSQVVSKYIGETEKNLRRVFDAAEEGGAILLFDEADALFGKRSEVKDSHDRYANIEVSYLLQRMECYRGLAILTTNRKNDLDPAFLRRIRFVVQFPFPDAAQRAEIWRRIFPAETPRERPGLRSAGAAERPRRQHPQHRAARRLSRRRGRRARANGAHPLRRGGRVHQAGAFVGPRRPPRLVPGRYRRRRGRMRKGSIRMKKTAEQTRRSTTPAASPPGFATASSQTAKISLTPAPPGLLAHHLGEIAIMSGESEHAGDRAIGRRAANVSDSPVATALPRPNNTGLPDKLKGGIESLSGFDMSDVRVHFNSPRPASLRALAYTQGTHIHVAPGQASHLPHEAWHVAQQKQGRVQPTFKLEREQVNDDPGLEHEADTMGAEGVTNAAGRCTAPGIDPAARACTCGPAPVVQRKNVDEMSPINRYRVAVKSEHIYTQKTREFEFALGPKLSLTKEANDIANLLLERLRKVVDAWADAIGSSTSSTYRQEFQFKEASIYYGSFQMTAKNIRHVFESNDEPLRKKLNLVYYAVRNNNLAKYLEVAALEVKEAVDAKAAGRPKKGVDILMELEGSPNERQTVKPGFAAASGLEETWKDVKKTTRTDDRAKTVLGIAQKRKLEEQRPLFGAKHRSNVFASGEVVEKGRLDKRYNQVVGLSPVDQETLKREDMPDMTSAEIRHMYELQGKRVPMWTSRFDKQSYLAKQDKRIDWVQGREAIAVLPRSTTDNLAMPFLAHLDAGISGSTDLMMGAGKQLGLNKDDLKKLRLALVGWMLSNRDHSFFEIMIAAEHFGPEFHRDPKRIGKEYQIPDNFYPLSEDTVAGFEKLLPEKQFPGYFLSLDYRNKLVDELAGGEKDKTAVLEGVGLANLNKNNTPARAVAEYELLDSVVKDMSFQPDAMASEAAARQNRVALQRLLKEKAYLDLARRAVNWNEKPYERASRQADTESNLVLPLITKHHGIHAVVSDDDLSANGVAVNNFGSTYAINTVDISKANLLRYDLARLIHVVAASGFKSDGANVKAFAKARSSPAYEAVALRTEVSTKNPIENRADKILDSIVDAFVRVKQSTLSKDVRIAASYLATLSPADLAELEAADKAMRKGNLAEADAALQRFSDADSKSVIKGLLIRHHIGKMNPQLAPLMSGDFKLHQTKHAAELNLAEQYIYTTGKEELRRLKESGVEADKSVATSVGPAYKDLRAVATSAKKDYPAQLGTLEPGEVIGLTGYSTGFYGKVNIPMRKNEALDPGPSAWAKAAASGMSKLPAYQGPPTFRHLKDFQGYKQLNKPGGVVSDMAFVSTAAKQVSCATAGAGHDILEIIAPKENGRGNGRNISAASMFRKETEILFIPGTRFQIVKRMDKQANGGWLPYDQELMDYLRGDNKVAELKVVIKKQEV